MGDTSLVKSYTYKSGMRLVSFANDRFRILGDPLTTKRGRTMVGYKHFICRDDIGRFTEGDCHIFALAIHDLTNWPLASFSYLGNPDTHCFIIAPDGRALDIEGPSHIDDFCRKWAVSSWRTFSRREWADAGWDLRPHLTDWSRRRAQQLMPIVVAETLATLDE